MDFVSLFFSPQGRIAKGPFWIGVIVLIVLGSVISAASTYGPPSLGLVFLLLVLLLIYPRVCVFVKRLHDAGKSGWWVLVVFLVFIVCSGGLGYLVSASHFADLQGVDPTTPEFQAAVRQLAKTTFLPSIAINIAMWLVAAFIVGMLPSDPGENRFGPPTTPVS